MRTARGTPQTHINPKFVHTLSVDVFFTENPETTEIFRETEAPDESVRPDARVKGGRGDDR